MRATDLLTTSQAAEIIQGKLGFGTAGTLKQWRCRDRKKGQGEAPDGPASTRVGRKAVRYRRGDVDVWIVAQTSAGDGGGS